MKATMEYMYPYRGKAYGLRGDNPLLAATQDLDLPIY